MLYESCLELPFKDTTAPDYALGLAAKINQLCREGRQLVARSNSNGALGHPTASVGCLRHTGRFFCCQRPTRPEAHSIGVAPVTLSDNCFPVCPQCAHLAPLRLHVLVLVPLRYPKRRWRLLQKWVRSVPGRVDDREKMRKAIGRKMELLPLEDRENYPALH